MGQVVLVVVVLIALAAVALARRRGWRLDPGSGAGFVIRSRAGGVVEVRGAVPKSKILEIQEFCTRDLDLERPFAIRGSWGAGRSLNLCWTGDFSAAQRQRTRNFLLQCLR